MIILLNPEKGADIDIIIEHKKYLHKVGETFTYIDSVGSYLLKTYPFLEETKAEASTGESIYKCPIVPCDFTSKMPIIVATHIKTAHPDAPKGNKLLKVTVGGGATPGNVPPEAQGSDVVSLNDIRAKKEEDLYARAEIPTGEGKDRDGVGWYGEGVTKDIL